MPTVDLYGRDGCHLCDDARAQLAALQAELGFELNDIDIEADDDLHRRYLERIPVVVLDGEHLFDFFVDEAVLRDRLGTVGGG
jgi:glutaredoxin